MSAVYTTTPNYIKETTSLQSYKISLLCTCHVLILD